jgi:formate dehydrogenase major subunit
LSQSTIPVIINGLTVAAEPGKTILDVVSENRLDTIPTLCHSADLEPYGSCFVCVVEIKGRQNLVPACATKIAPGMQIETHSERVIASRKTALELLLSNHYADCLPPCRLSCPAGVDTQGYLALAAMGLYQEAVDLIRQDNPLPAICGRICVRKCEVTCRREVMDEPVNINAIKRYCTDRPGMYDRPSGQRPTLGKSVGIIGSGPAGLAAAWFLVKQGYDPVIYEAMERGGGMLRYGIPSYRLPDDVLDREIEYISRSGVSIEYNVRVGIDLTLDELYKRHKAVFIAAGAWATKPMMVKGEFETQGVLNGIDFLRKAVECPEQLSGIVVVVGGGNTAMDVARTAWRLGADKVIILYRRTKSEMPADPEEIEECIKEGIELIELAAPVGIITEENRLKALRCQRMKLGDPDASGRRRPVPIEGSEFDLPCTIAISAIGQGPLLDGLDAIGEEKIQQTRWQTVSVDPDTLQTNINGVFAGGDVADDGPTVVIDAIADGRKAAESIHVYLSKEASKTPQPFVVKKDFFAKPGKADLGAVPESPRHHVHTIEIEKRKNCFNEVATGFKYEDTVHETHRCLACGCIKYKDCVLRQYAEEYKVDMNRFAGHVRKHKVDDRHPYIIYDPNKCILCARCIRTCSKVLPLPAIGLVGRGFKTEMRPAMNDPLAQTNCTSCGNCVDACPTGALMIKYPFPGRAALQTVDTESRCAFCSIGCAIKINKFGQARYFIDSSGIPGKYLCRYGRFGHELFIQKKRLESPLINEKGTRRTIDFPEAFRTTAGSLLETAEKYGPRATAVFISPELTNEELYLAARIARQGLKTNNVGSLTMLTNTVQPGVLDRSFGFTACTADRNSLQKADLIICNNSNTEADHLLLNIEIIQSVRKGARLMVVNSTLISADFMLASLNMDPVRGSASILWEGIIQKLIDSGFFAEKQIKSIPGADEFLKRNKYSDADVTDITGVTLEKIVEAVNIIRTAKKIVFIHTPDRMQDSSPGDLQTLANLIALLHAAGVEADLLLPRMMPNGAAVDIMGACPEFLPGRISSTGFQGAHDCRELMDLLTSGKIKAALVIGENPFCNEKNTAYFENMDFLAAMDWAMTETVQLADVALPGTTFLETGGTRCNFEGKVMRFPAGVMPPSGLPGWMVLHGLAREFGLELPVAEEMALFREMDALVRKNLGIKTPFYWNTGEAREWDGKGMLIDAGVKAGAASLQPPLTHVERYKKAIRDVGIGRFRVHA